MQGSKTSPVVEMLQKTSLWSSLSEKELKVIAEESRELTFNRSHVIVEKGSTGVGFFLIVEGMVEVRSEGRVLSKLGPGQFFGEMSLLDDKPRSADVVAVEPSRCLGLTTWSFSGIVSHHPKIALKVMQELIRRLRETDQAPSE